MYVLVAMEQTSEVNIFHLNFASGFLVETKIKSNLNTIIGGKWWKNKETIDKKFTEQIVNPEIMKNLLTLDGRMY